MPKFFALRRLLGISSTLKFPSKSGYQRKKFGGRGNKKKSPLSTIIRSNKKTFKF